MVLKIDNPPEEHKKLLPKFKDSFSIPAVLPNVMRLRILGKILEGRKLLLQ